MVNKEVSSQVAESLKTVKPFYTRLNQPPKPVMKSSKPTKVQESPLDARSPQEVLDYHGMYKDPSYYEKNVDKIYLDFTQFDDYETYLNNLNQMKANFQKLPLDVRARFNHSPEELFKFVGSSQFDIEKLMDDKTLDNYKRYKAEEKSKAEHDAYIKSKEYLQQVELSKYRAEYEKQQFDAWMKQNHADVASKFTDVS